MGGAGRTEVSGAEPWQWTFLSSILVLWEQTLRDRRVLSLGEDSLGESSKAGSQRERERALRHGACYF